MEARSGAGRPANKAEGTKARYDLGHALLVGSTALMALFAAPPVYWGYLCRSSGTWCEGSYIPPRTGDDVRQEVARRIADSAPGRNFTGLRVREAGFWPFSNRLDVVAKFSDGSETAIDTLPREIHSYEVYNDPSSKFVGIIAPSRNRDSARLIAYFPSLQLTRRAFDFSARGYQMSLGNLTYVEESKKLVFDVRASFQWITVNDDRTLAIGGRSNEKWYGTTVALTLSDTLHVQSIYPVERELKHRRSEQAFKGCLEKIEADPKEDGDVFVCYRAQSEDLTSDNSAVVVFEWRQGALKEVDQSSCDYAYWVRDPSKKTMFVTCDPRRETRSQSNPEAHVWLSVYQHPFDDVTYFVEGKCRDISLFKMRWLDETRIGFELWTDCARISIDGREFGIDIKEGERMRAMYELQLDKNGMAISLRPMK